MFSINHTECTGCGACMDACPQTALVKRLDRYKFVYPSVCDELCDRCGKCLEVCPIGKPISQKNRDISFQQEYFITASRDKRAIIHSHSGGLFWVMGKKILSEGGIVYGCMWDDDRHPVHARADNLELLKKMRGYKPVQSDTAGIYSSVKTDLERGKRVLFSGTPCQCDGLLGYLGKRYDDLIILDMLCGGVTSEGIFNRYHYWMGQMLKGKILELKFENKKAFGHSRGVKIIFAKKGQRFLLSLPLELDMLNSMSMHGVVNRKSCGCCKYATQDRVGDITLGCFAHPGSTHPEFPYYLGASLAIISTDNGKKFFESISSELYYERADIDQAMANQRLQAPTHENKKRKELLSAVYRYGFDKAVEQFKQPNIFQRAAVFFRSVFPDRLAIAMKKLKRKSVEWLRKAENFVKDIKNYRGK